MARASEAADCYFPRPTRRLWCDEDQDWRADHEDPRAVIELALGTRAAH
ncbi:hypothetical protein [Pseudofrankia sp. BMG5.37]|nr:hypothetical protein [Pseudofrankia sp. BMG5.37]MDT3445210.1 hypothetical protein [Pseudofrankia sp. BMG5.37]